MNEEELMKKVGAGDEEAFQQIVSKYQRLMLNLCYQYVGNQQDAEELTQDVFIKLFHAAPSYEPRAKLSTYLYRIAINLSLNRIRDRKRKRLVSLDYLHQHQVNKPTNLHQGTPDLLLEQKEKEQLVRKAIDSLPRNQKTAVILKRYQGLSYEEMAKVMNCSVSAVESRLHRAKQTLMKKLKPLMT